MDGYEYSLERYSRLVMIAMGKAAGTMTRAFLHVAGRLRDGLRVWWLRRS